MPLRCDPFEERASATDCIILYLFLQPAGCRRRDSSSIHHPLEHADAAASLCALRSLIVDGDRASDRFRLRIARAEPCARRSAPGRPCSPEPLRDEIPAAELSAVMAAHFKGLGFDGAV